MSFAKFDLSNVDTSNTIPAGEYEVFCVSAKVEEKADDKQFIVAEMRVTGGNYDGRKIYERFTTRHPNPKAVQVGLGKLKRFLQAANYKNPNELELMEMTGLHCLATVKVETAEGYDPRNTISSYKKTKGDGSTSSSTSPFGS